MIEDRFYRRLQITDQNYPNNLSKIGKIDLSFNVIIKNIKTVLQ